MWGDADVLKQWYPDSGDGYTVLGIVDPLAGTLQKGEFYCWLCFKEAVRQKPPPQPKQNY